MFWMTNYLLELSYVLNFDWYGMGGEGGVTLENFRLICHMIYNLCTWLQIEL